jgi:uncharacterized protein (UPF0548 family)
VSRKPLWNLPVNYAAVGATQTQEAMAFPPAGYHPFEKRVRVGTGPARWDFAWHATLAWGIPIRSGFTVELTETPPEVSEGSYSPVTFDTGGVPVSPASTPSDEAVYGPDGIPFVKAGDSVWLRARFGPFRLDSPVRVIYVIDEPNRKGFACGTLPGHPISGEEAFIVDTEPDGSVWLTLRVLWRPATLWGRIGFPVLVGLQRMIRARYLKALTGPVD